MGSGSVVGEEVVGRLLVLVSLSGRVMERVWGRLGAVGGRGGPPNTLLTQLMNLSKSSVSSALPASLPHSMLSLCSPMSLS